MASALASYVLPGTDELINGPISVIGTLLGALCFLIGAILMFAAWRQAIRESSALSHRNSRQHSTP
jgi:hypothetical protein